MMLSRAFARRLPLLTAAWLLLIAASLSAQAERLVRVTLLQLNDVYQISPVDRGRRGGLARVAALRKKIQTESPHTLFLLAGDTLAPSVASNIFKGKQMIAAWNALGLDYAALGNHEFDFGDDVLRERMGESKFPWLAANVIDRKTGKPFNDMPPYVIREFDGVRVGLFGVLTADTKTSSKPGPDVEFRDPVQTAKRIFGELKRKGAQVVVAVTHLSMSQDKALARAVPVDLILGGHEHEVLQSLAGRAPILKAGSDARSLGRIDLFIDADRGRLSSMDWELIPVTSDLPEEPQAAAVIGEYEKQISTALDQPVGRVSVELDARQATNRSRETNLGSFIADAYRKQVGADVALLNSGAIRSNTTYGPGVLTKRDVLSILPFENPIVKLEIPGATLRAALEHGLGRIVEDKEEGRFPQIAGMRIVYDGRKPAGSRLVSVAIGGQPLDNAKTYTLATNSYLYEGGDGYAMLKNLKALISPEEGAVEPAVIIEALATADAIAPRADGRIQRLDAPAE